MFDELDSVLERLARSPFRHRFQLRAEEREYLERKGLETVMAHAEKFIEERLASAQRRQANSAAEPPHLRRPAWDSNVLPWLPGEMARDYEGARPDL
jgi:Domain of unknown function (DUF4186)